MPRHEPEVGGLLLAFEVDIVSNFSAVSTFNVTGFCGDEKDD